MKEPPFDKIAGEVRDHFRSAFNGAWLLADSMRFTEQQLRQVYFQSHARPRALAEWHEDYGSVLWWYFDRDRVRIEEPPYAGTPLDSDWPGYHTHWTPILIPPGPIRVQRRRARNWRMPANTLYVGRGSRWGNPFTAADSGLAGPALRYAAEVAPLLDLKPLRGKNLACWCPLDQSCHADVLLDMANR